MAKARLVLSIDEDLIRKLKVKAAEEGLSVSEWLEERLREWLDEYGAMEWHDDYRQCIYCGRRINGYGSICEACKQECEQIDRERMAQLWAEAKAELDRLMEEFRKRNL